MKISTALALLIMLLPGAAHAQQLKPMAKGVFDGIPLDQAMSTLRVLGKWILPRDGTLQVFTMSGGSQKGCLGAETDPDQCASARLYVAAEDSPVEVNGLAIRFSPETYFLLRGVNGLGWYLPENEPLKFITDDHFSLLVCGSKFTTQLSDGAVVPTAYTLDVTRQHEKDNRYSFSATMEKYGDNLVKIGCGADHMMARDENFHVVPSLMQPGAAPR
ncbi:MAG TPA: hypothetical protein VGK90_09675 [Rhizomicrobium sp.]